MQNQIFDYIKRHAFFILGGACLVVVGIIYMVIRGSGVEVIRVEGGESVFAAEANEPANEPAYTPAPAAPPTPTPEPEIFYIAVHVVGAVNSPGVVELREGTRVVDALDLAGGASDEADLTRINLAAVLRDAMQIIVPAYGDEITEVFIFADDMSQAATSGVQTAGGSAGATGQNQSGLVNINTASAAELQTLPGIGPVLSQNIIDFREAHGNFTSVDQLINVSRIGSATLERIRDLVTVG